MIDKVNTLIEAIRPIRLVRDLGIDIHSKKEYYFIKEPRSIQNSLFLKDKEFVNSNPFAEFRAGNIVTFFAHYYGKTIEEALNELLDRYFNKLSQPIYSSVSWAVNSMSVLIEAQDSLCNDINANKRKLVSAPRYSKCRQYLKNLGFSEHYIKAIVAPFTGDELSKTLKKVSEIFPGLKTDYPKSRRYIVFPIYANYSTICAIWILCIESKKLDKFKILPYSHGFFGLHNLRPDDNCVYVLPSVSKVIAESHYYYDHGGPASQCCVSVEYEEEGTILPDPIYRGIMTIDNDTKTTEILKIQNSFHELGLINKKQLFKVGFEHAQEARTYLTTKFMIDVGRGVLDSPNFSEYLKELQTDPIVIERIKHQLRHSNKQEILALVESRLNKTEIKNIKGNIITTTKDGYVASGKKHLADVLFTNFTTQITKTIMFRDSADTYYMGELYISGHSLPYMLSKKEVNKANSIVHAATASVASSELLDSMKPPALLDSTFASTLTGILADQVNCSQIVLGVADLGWSENFETFTAPGWSATGSDINKGGGFKHPGKQILNNFNFYPKSLNRDVAIFNNPNFNILTALITSMLGRSYLKMQCSPIRILNSEVNRLLLASLMSIFQQKRTIDLNPNLRVSRTGEKMLRGLSGYPIVCSCSNPNVINRLFDPAFVLSNNGLDFSNDDPKLYEDLKTFSSYYIPHLINELISSDGSVFVPNYEDRSLESMVKEGLNTMKLLLAENTWYITTGNHQNLHRWLSQQHIELLQEFIKLDFEQQKIKLHLPSFPNFKKVKQELKNAGVSTHKMSKEYIVVDSGSFLKLLGEIFVEVPKIGSCKLPDKLKKLRISNEADSVGLG